MGNNQKKKQEAFLFNMHRQVLLDKEPKLPKPMNKKLLRKTAIMLATSAALQRDLLN